MNSNHDTSPTLFPLTSRQPTPQLSGENMQLIEAKAELSRVVERYGFSITSQAWEWLVVDHNMTTGEMLVDPSRSLDPPFAFTPPMFGLLHHHHHPGDLQLLRLPTPALEMHDFSMPKDEPEAMHASPLVEFQFVVSTDDDDDDADVEEKGKR